MVDTPFSSRALKWLHIIVLGLTSMHLFLQYLNLEVFYQQQGQVYELSNRFDLDDESSASTWLSEILFLLIGISALLVAYLEKSKPSRFIWQSIAVVGILFSIDEASGIHEYLLQTLHVAFFQDNSPSSIDNAWWLAAPFILAVAGFFAWKMIKLLPWHTTRIFLAAGLVFISGAVAIDLIISVDYRETFLNQGLLVAIEEGQELLGMSVALYAIFNYLELNYNTPLTKAFNQLKSSKKA